MLKKKLTAKLAQLDAIPMVPLPATTIGLIKDESQLLCVEVLRGLITVDIALFSRLGVLLKLKARLTAIRVLDANLAALLNVPDAKSLVSMSSCRASIQAK